MEELTNENIKKLMEIKGEVRGVVFKTDIEYVLREKGKKGLQETEKELMRLDFPMKLQEIKTMDFYPAWLRVLSILAIKKVFNFEDKEIEEMGFFATKKSLIIKLFVKYFLSVQTVFYKEAPRIWEKHWTIGKLVPVEINEKEKYAILSLKNFNLHPVYCFYLKGYFKGILQMMIKTQTITCEETECFFRGDQYHEYLIKWK